MVSGSHYKVHRDNRIHIETATANGRVMIHVFPAETHMPRVVSVDLSQAGVPEAYVVIKLSPRPLANKISVDQGGVVSVLLYTLSIVNNIPQPLVNIYYNYNVIYFVNIYFYCNY